MCISRSLIVVAGLCSMIMAADGQTNDWRSVESLSAGTAISVVKRGRMGCDLVRATSSELICDLTIGRTRTTYFLKRAQVREVRLELPDNNRRAEGAAVGGAVGGLLGFLGAGQLGHPELRGYAHVYGVPVGAFLGGAIGQQIHAHGPVVYRK